MAIKSYGRKMAMAESKWSRLPGDILTLIAKCLDSPIDTLCLRSVCHSWRSSLATFKRKPLFPVPLPFPIHQNLPPERNNIGHFILSHCTMYFILPACRDQLSKCQKPRLLRVEDLRNWKDCFLDFPSWNRRENVPLNFPKELNLLDFNVFKIVRAFSLDYVETETLYSLKVAVSSHPFTIGGGDLEVMAVFGKKLGFIRLGDKEWRWIYDVKQPHDVIYHKGKFYVLDREGNIFVITSDLKVVHIAEPITVDGQDITCLAKHGEDLYLIDYRMEWTYEDFLGDDCLELTNSDVKFQCKIYKLNEVDKKWDKVSSLGDKSIFHIDGRLYFVSAKDFAEMVPNSVQLLGSKGLFTGKNESLGDSTGVALALLKNCSIILL